MSDTIAKGCSASVHRDGWRVQCSRRAIPGGDLCAIHTPEAVAARKAKLHAKWAAQQKAHEERAAARRAQEERQARALFVAEEVVPELVSACRNLLTVASLHNNDTDAVWATARDAARAAIARAEGYTS